MTTDNNQHTGIDWPDGWYLYDNGAITGPYKTKDAFARDDSNQNEDLMVSRKGFSQWYSYNDLVQLYRQADKTFLSGNMSVKEIEKSLNNDIERLANMLKQVEKEAVIQLRKDTTLEEISDPNGFKPRGLKELEQGISSIENLSDRQGKPLQIMNPVKNPVVKKDLSPRTSQTMSKENNLFFQDSHTNSKSTITKNPEPSKIQQSSSFTTIGMQSKAKSAAPQIKKQTTPFTSVPNYGPTTKESQLVYNHMMLAGRLRLGSLSDPLMESFIKFFASLGLYFGFWVRKSYDQSFYHLTGRAPNNPLQVFFAIIPILHLYEIYRLSIVIQQMELQNGYKRTSPWLAIVLALFPPFVMMYLQKSLNSHWTLHVMSATKKN